MSRTLLYTVQRVIEKLDLDPVNSINDSEDAILIAREAESTFYDLLSRNEWPDQYDLIEIESVSDIYNPTALRLPTNTTMVSSFRYDVTGPDDTETIIRQLEQVDTEEFLRRIYNRSSIDTDITIANYKDIPLYIYNNQTPSYFTTFDNETIILDSWYQSEESTVQGSKSIVRASTIPVFLVDPETAEEVADIDTYIIPLEVTVYPLYLSELTAACSMMLNGAQAIEEERRRNRSISRLRQKAFRTDVNIKRNDFGRRGTGRT